MLRLAINNPTNESKVLACSFPIRLAIRKVTTTIRQGRSDSHQLNLVFIEAYLPSPN
jgi:hypothetical protein